MCSRNVGVLNKVKHFLPKTSLYKLYCSLIMPYLTYGILSKEYMTKLFRIQKRVLRIVSNSSYKEELGIFMYKYKAGLLPTTLDHSFTNLKSIYLFTTMDTRNKPNSVLKFIKSVLTDDLKLWNSLPHETRTASSANVFNKKHFSVSY